MCITGVSIDLWSIVGIYPRLTWCSAEFSIDLMFALVFFMDCWLWMYLSYLPLVGYVWLVLFRFLSMFNWLLFMGSFGYYGLMTPYSRMAHVVFYPASLVFVWSLFCLCFIVWNPFLLVDPCLGSSFLPFWMLDPFVIASSVFDCCFWDWFQAKFISSHFTHPCVLPLVLPWQLPEQRKRPKKKKDSRQSNRPKHAQ